MNAMLVSAFLAFAAVVSGHGYVYRITADNTVYPGWDVAIDPFTTPTPPRIAFGGGGVASVNDFEGPYIACNFVHSPPPGAIAEVRAGSTITFHWSQWLYSHKGPITAWMAPYSGSVADVNVNDLEFIKFAEDTIDKDGAWGTVRMMDQTNGSWTATIPADIKPGTYVVRQEIIALHFAVTKSPGFEMFPTGPQSYHACFNFNVTGTGTATPQGVKFPGAYKLDEPGFHFDLSSNKSYPTVGPPLYKSQYEVKLEPKPRVVINPTDKGPEADAAYYQTQSQVLLNQATLVSYFDSIGG